VHFPAAEAFDDDYFAQLTSERRETRKHMGQNYQVSVLPSGKQNEALDTFVYALAVRRALPHKIEAGLEFSIVPGQTPAHDAAPKPLRPKLPPQERSKSLAAMLAR
jgi:phage terminase large subunit GpA-like protein